MKRLNIEFHRVYFKYLIWSTDLLLARKARGRAEDGHEKHVVSAADVA